MSQYPFIETNDLESMRPEWRKTLLELSERFVSDNAVRMEEKGIEEKNINLREALELVLAFLSREKIRVPSGEKTFLRIGQNTYGITPGRYMKVE